MKRFNRFAAAVAFRLSRKPQQCQEFWAWHSSWTNSFAGIRIWRAAPATCGATFDAAHPADELKTIEERVGSPDFWKDQAAAQKLLQRRRRLEEDRDLSESLRKRLEDLTVLVEWGEAGEPVADDLGRALDDLSAQVDAGETKKMLGGEHDRKNAIITIHPGAGGTESQDWAEMLLRMYIRWTERKGFKREVMDFQPGDEAGIKSATLTIAGDYAYGMLLAEAGVHRLVRISPYDQASRRHTSFASLYVWPELPDDVDVEIDEKDLRVDTYRSSGAGGQHVNVTDSAIRTHAHTHRHCRLLSERAFTAQEPRAGDEGAEGQALRPEDEGAGGQAGTARRRKEGHCLRQPDSQLRAASLPDGEGPPNEGRGGERRIECSTATSTSSSRPT